MNDIIRSNTPVFPDGISIRLTKDKNIAIIDFLSEKLLPNEKSVHESIFSVALTKGHLRKLREALEDMDDDNPSR